MADQYKVGPYSGRDISELASYVQRELARIEEGFRVAWGGGTIFRAEVTPPAAITLPADASYVKLDQYDSLAPARDFRRVIPDLANAQLVVRDVGTWGVLAVVNGTGLSSQRDYEARLFFNGVETGAFSVVDLSNQTTQSEFTVAGVARVLPGLVPGVLDVRVRQRTVGQAAPFTVAGLYLMAWAVGD